MGAGSAGAVQGRRGRQRSGSAQRRGQKSGIWPGNSATTYPSSAGCAAPSSACLRDPGHDTSSPLPRAPGGSCRANRPATTAISRRHSGQFLRREDMNSGYEGSGGRPRRPRPRNRPPGCSRQSRQPGDRDSVQGPRSPLRAHHPRHAETPSELQERSSEGVSLSVAAPGFEPGKAEPADLQSAPFGRSGTPPGSLPFEPLFGGAPWQRRKRYPMLGGASPPD